MSGFEVWLFLVFIPNLPNLMALIGIMSIVMIVVGIGIYVYHMDCSIKKKWDWDKNEYISNEEELRAKEHPKFVKRVKIGVIGLISSVLVSIGIPDKKEIAAIILIPYVSSNAEFRKLPENLAKKLNDYLTNEFQVKDVAEKVNGNS